MSTATIKKQFVEFLQSVEQLKNIDKLSKEDLKLLQEKLEVLDDNIFEELCNKVTGSCRNVSLIVYKVVKEDIVFSASLDIKEYLSSTVNDLCRIENIPNILRNLNVENHFIRTISKGEYLFTVKNLVIPSTVRVTFPDKKPAMHQVGPGRLDVLIDSLEFFEDLGSLEEIIGDYKQYYDYWAPQGLKLPDLGYLKMYGNKNIEEIV